MRTSSSLARWWLFAALALLINAYAVHRIVRALEQRAPQAHAPVAWCLPDGAVISNSVELTWTFGVPATAAAEIGVWRAEGPVSFTPRVPGRFCWMDARTLRFEPAAPWPACSEFTAAFDEAFATRHGMAAGAQQRRFQTPALALLAASAVAADADRVLTIHCIFTAPPDLQRIKEFLTISAGGSPIRYDVEGAVASRTVRIKTGPVRRDTCTLTVQKGLPPALGTRGTESSVTVTVAVPVSFAFEKLSGRSDAFDPSEIEIYFSAPVKLPEAQEFITVAPPVTFTASSRYHWEGGCCVLRGAFEPGARYAVTLRAGLPSAEGAALSTDVTRTVYLPDRPAAVAFRGAGEYLSPRGSMLVPVTSVNVPEFTVQAERIFPNNLVQFAMRQSRQYSGWWGDDQDGISQITGTRVLPVAFAPNAATQTYLRLSELMGAHRAGAYWLTVSTRRHDRDQQLVIVSDIGVTAKHAAHDLLIWANSLRDATPLSGAWARVYSQENQVLAEGATDASGLWHCEDDFSSTGRAPFLVTVAHGDDLTYLALEAGRVRYTAQTTGRAFTARGYEAYVYTDRGICRPGETAHASVLVRDDALATPPPFPIELRAVRPDGRVWRSWTQMLNERGAADVAIEWPQYLRTGRYTLEARVPGTALLGTAHVALEEFVPPQIAVRIETESERTNGTFSFGVRAEHLFGAPAAGLAVQAATTLTPSAFSHAAWPGFVFEDTDKEFASIEESAGSGVLDEEGRLRFTAAIAHSLRPPSALNAVLSATVVEPSGRAVSAVAQRAVDVYPCYVGIKAEAEGSIVRAGEEQRVALAAVAPDGTPAASVAALRVVLASVSWNTVLKRRSSGVYEYESARIVSPVASNDVALRGGRGAHVFTPPGAGQYVLSVSDTNGGASACWSFYAGRPGDEWQSWPQEQPAAAALHFDKPFYHEGDEAVLRITAPFAGRALLALESWRVIETRVIEMTQNTCVVSIPVRAEYAPNIYASVSIIRPVRAERVRAPARAAGCAALVVARPQRQALITMQVLTAGVPLQAAAPAVLPRATLTCALAVTNAPGELFDVTLAAVDEGICMLTDFASPDPLRYFAARRALGVTLCDLYQRLLPELDAALLAGVSAPGGDGGYGGALRRRLNPMDARRFTPVALWSGRIATDTSGAAAVTLALPEFAGTLRLMAVAASAQRLGALQQALLVKAPLVVRSSAPRFLAPRDRSTLSVQLYNESVHALTAQVMLSLSPPLSGSTNFPVLIARGAQAACVLPLDAGAAPAVAGVRLRVTSSLSQFDDAFELAVRPPAPLALQTGWGVVPAGVCTNVLFPGGWVAGTARNTLWCSGYPAVQWRRALDFVLTYPYGCLEQTVSAAMPLLYMSDLAAAAQPGSMGVEEVQRRVSAGIYRILSMQLANGAFVYWPRTTEEYEWGSAYAAHFLAAARRADYEVPEAQFDAAMRYLEHMLTRRSVTRDAEHEAAWRDDTCLRAYACWALALAERPAASWLARLQEHHEMLAPAARAYLAAALAAANRRGDAGALLRAIGLPAPGAVPREAAGCLHSDPGTWAVLLAAWLDVDPHDAAVPLLVQRIERAMHDEQARTTFDTARALYALGLYAQRCLGTRQPLQAVVAWNDGATNIAIDHTQDWHLEPVFTHGTQVVVSNAGPAPLFYAWQTRGIPRDGAVQESDRQLAVRRTLRDARSVVVTNAALARGALYVVQLSLDTFGATRRNLVVEDLLPAGLEVENAQLHTSQTLAWLPRQAALVPQHIEQRDDRLVLFIDRLHGSNAFYYSARAVTPGEYIWPPASAECMYDPSVRSVHGTATLRVE